MIFDLIITVVFFILFGCLYAYAEVVHYRKGDTDTHGWVKKLDQFLKQR